MRPRTTPEVLALHIEIDGPRERIAGTGACAVRCRAVDGDALHRHSGPEVDGRERGRRGIERRLEVLSRPERTDLTGLAQGGRKLGKRRGIPCRQARRVRERGARPMSSPDRSSCRVSLDCAGGRRRWIGRSGSLASMSCQVPVRIGDEAAAGIRGHIARGGQEEVSARQGDRRRAGAFDDRQALKAELDLDRRHTGGTARALVRRFEVHGRTTASTLSRPTPEQNALRTVSSSRAFEARLQARRPSGEGLHEGAGVWKRGTRGKDGDALAVLRTGTARGCQAAHGARQHEPILRHFLWPHLPHEKV